MITYNGDGTFTGVVREDPTTAPAGGTVLAPDTHMDMTSREDPREIMNIAISIIANRLSVNA